MDEAAPLAALNNAEWCDAISAAHGAQGLFEAGFWVNSGTAPPFYPNLVTLDPAAAEAQRVAIEHLIRIQPKGFAVKDSFARLELSELGFEIAFGADWIRLGPEIAISPAPTPLEVTVAANPDDLSEWERAWGGDESGPLFPPALLRDQRIAFLSVFCAGKMLAGAALNRSASVLGLSNVFFLQGSDVRACLAALIDTARAQYPALPIVGYEQTDAQPPFLAIGFKRIGPLRIWVRS